MSPGGGFLTLRAGITYTLRFHLTVALQHPNLLDDYFHEPIGFPILLPLNNRKLRTRTAYHKLPKIATDRLYIQGQPSSCETEELGSSGQPKVRFYLTKLILLHNNCNLLTRFVCDAFK